MTRIFFAALLIGILSGCASSPKIGEVGSISTGIADRNNFAQVYEAMPAHITNFDSHWQKLESDQWGNSELTYSGSGLAVLAAAAQSTPYAIGGALVAALATADDKVFGPDKQNIAWTKASHAYTCMHGFSTPLYVGRNFLSDQVGSPDSNTEGGDVYAARALFDSLTQVDYALTDRLRINAVSSAPDWNAIAASVKAAATSQPAPIAPDKATALSKLSNDDQVHVTQLRTLLGRYKSDLTTCIVSN